MKGEYLSPVKQEVFKDWQMYMYKTCLPHTQTCPECNMLLTVDSLADVRAYSNGRNANHPFFIRCLGCNVPSAFSGTDHLPKSVQIALFDKMDDWQSIRHTPAELSYHRDPIGYKRQKWYAISVAVLVFFIMFILPVILHG